MFDIFLGRILPPACTHELGCSWVFLTPSQGSAGLGWRNLRFPTGGWAYGTPYQADTFLLSEVAVSNPWIFPSFVSTIKSLLTEPAATLVSEPRPSVSRVTQRRVSPLFILFLAPTLVLLISLVVTGLHKLVTITPLSLLKRNTNKQESNSGREPAGQLS